MDHSQLCSISIFLTDYTSIMVGEDGKLLKMISKINNVYKVCLLVNIIMSQDEILQNPYYIIIILSVFNLYIISLFMKLISIVMSLIIIIMVSGQPLKAMLYCYLPYTNQGTKTQEYGKLVRLIQEKLDALRINVQVSLCNEQQSWDLYDPSRINTLWNTYQILQIDDMYIQAITQPLLQINQNDFTNFNNIIPQQFIPLERRNSAGQNYYIGSPGLMCTDFIQWRLLTGSTIKDQMLTNLNSSYSLTSLYLGFYFNKYPLVNLQTFDYNGRIDPIVLREVIEILKKCQVDKSNFDYIHNNCLNSSMDGEFFIERDYKSTIGYSQNLYNFFVKFPGERYDFEHVMGNRPKKLIYLDSFIAKNTANKQTVVKFYNAMLSDDIVSIYTNGLYLNQPRNTYLLPPTTSKFQSLSNADAYYRKYYNILFASNPASVLNPIYQSQYYQNFETLFNNIKTQLRLTAIF